MRVTIIVVTGIKIREQWLKIKSTYNTKGIPHPSQYSFFLSLSCCCFMPFSSLVFLLFMDKAIGNLATHGTRAEIQTDETE